MLNYEQSVKAAFGEVLHGFHSQLMADTPGVQEFATRRFSKACVWAPGRMIDQVEEMLNSWRKNNTSEETQTTPFLTVIVAAMEKSFMPSGPEYGRGLGDPVEVILENDPKQRVFRMRVAHGDYRVQLAIIGPDGATVRSIAMQLHLYMSAMARRTFYATYLLAGSIPEQGGVQIENPDLMAVATPAPDGVKNLTIMSVDLTLRATTPFIEAPKPGEANDGKGGEENPSDPTAPNYDPPGYPYVIAARGENFPPSMEATEGHVWTVGAWGDKTLK